MVDNVDGDSVHLQKLLGERQFKFCAKYFLPAAKRVGADLLANAAPEVAEVVSARNNFKIAAKSVGRQRLRKLLGSGSRKRTASNVNQ